MLCNPDLPGFAAHLPSHAVLLTHPCFAATLPSHCLDHRYDCDVSIRDGSRGGSLFLRFSGYGTDEEEPLTDLSALRYSSLAANASDCVRLVPGTLVSGFKRSVHDDLWIDAEVVGRQEAKHAGGKCRCR